MAILRKRKTSRYKEQIAIKVEPEVRQLYAHIKDDLLFDIGEWHRELLKENLEDLKRKIEAGEIT